MLPIRHGAGIQVIVLSLDRRLMAAAVCATCLTAWMLAGDFVAGPGGSVLIIVALAGLVTAGWYSLWALPLVLLAPSLGYLLDRVGPGNQLGDLTFLSAAVLIVLPVSVALILVGAGAAKVRRSFIRRRDVKGQS